MKIKVKIKLLALIILLSVPIMYLIIKPEQNKKEPKIEELPQENYISDILTYNLDNRINNEFLEWILNNYGINTLKEIKKHLEENTYDVSVWHELTNNSFLVLNELYNNINADNVKIIEQTKEEVTISFIGDVSLADNFEIIPYYDSRGKKIYGILDEQIVTSLNQADLLIANNEFTISDRGTPMPNKIYTFRALPERVNIYNEMGVDLVTLANNHVYDFGENAFLDTLEILKKANMPYIGAGKNINEAKEPYYFIINGYKIGFVNATRAEKYILTPAATETTPGVLRTYDPTIFLETIKNTKENSDYVIALIHWGKEDSHELEQVQKETGKLYIDAGADAIIGTHAHVLQGIEFYKNKPIVYNIGDFIFNRESKPTGIFNLKLNNNGNLSYSFIPCYQENYKTTMLEDEKKQELLTKMENWSINANFDSDGNIKESN